MVDGSGAPGYKVDIGVSGGRIAAIGAISERGAEDIDAAGCIVTPGFIDAHTHMDAQIHWDPIGTSSCWHGVTTVVMGNCGFTLASWCAPNSADWWYATWSAPKTCRPKSWPPA